uniref:Microtubule-actin cross-linking factor 1 n=1 Tax=Xiphophorus couchianus TaxID=32473 RepID=A0A3B5LLH5_9TELE
MRSRGKTVTHTLYLPYSCRSVSSCVTSLPLASDSTSGGCCPLPGDTLPWNLQKHQRMKRSKSASGDVLDPAERAVIRIAGEALWRLPCQTDRRHLRSAPVSGFPVSRLELAFFHLACSCWWASC